MVLLITCKRFVILFNDNIKISGISKEPWRDGVVIRASASQSVDLGFIPLVESYQKTSKNDIHSFPAWRLAFRGDCGEEAGKFACCVLGQGTQRNAPAFMRKTGGPDI